MRGLREIDRILRGDATAGSDLRDRGLTLRLGDVILANVLLAAFAGLCMGVYGIANREVADVRFMLADAVKVPLLFLLSLAITFPSLYVFNALVGSSLGVAQLGKLMTSALAVLLAVLAAFGPILAFFSVTSSSYPFIVLLNVTLFIIAGGFGFDFLWRTMVKLSLKPLPPPRIVSPTTDPSTPSPEPNDYEDLFPAEPNRGVVAVFRLWLLVFGLVGAQMSWVLRPFIGSPNTEFTWFRPRDASFFEAISRVIRTMFS